MHSAGVLSLADRSPRVRMWRLLHGTIQIAVEYVCRRNFPVPYLAVGTPEQRACKTRFAAIRQRP